MRRTHAAAPGTERERLFVAAVETFFQDLEAPDDPSRLKRWAAAQEKVYLAFPGDREERR